MTTHLVAVERARRSAAPDTATQPRPPRRYRDGDVMGVSFSITPRTPGMPPKPEDVVRVSTVRRIVAARLRCCGLGAMTTEVMLAVSVLLTNSLLHTGGTSIGFLMAVGDGALCIGRRP